MAQTSTKGFEGFTGEMAGRLMARLNADMERAAIRLVRPRVGQRFLVLGSGPGVGLTALLDAAPPSGVLALEPSPAMVAASTRRLGRHAYGHLVQTVPLCTHELPRTAGPFDAAIAVNSQQLWDPHSESALALGHALEAGGRFVSLTHTWAIEKHQPVDLWKTMVANDLEAAGFAEPEWATAKYRSGDAVVMTTAKVRAI